MRKNYTGIPKEIVLQAVIDRAEGNRNLTSRAYLERRIAEIHYDRGQTNAEFTEFEKTFWKIKE